MDYNSELTVKFQSRDLGRLSEVQLLNDLCTLVSESDISGIQVLRNEVQLSFSNKEAKLQAIAGPFVVNNRVIDLFEVDYNVANIIINDLPVFIPESEIIKFLEKHADRVGKIEYGYVRRSDGTKTSIKTGTRYVKASGIKTPIPTFPVIGNSTARLFYDGQPCHHCSLTDHRANRCPNKEQRVVTCFRCGLEGHVARACVAHVVCHACGQTGHRATDCTVIDALEEEMSSSSVDLRRVEKVSNIFLGDSLLHPMRAGLQDDSTVVLSKSGAGIGDMYELLSNGAGFNKDEVKHVVLQCGTNDIVYQNEMPAFCIAKMESLTHSIIEACPNSEILVSAVPPIKSGDDINANIEKVNKYLKTMCEGTAQLCFVENNHLFTNDKGEAVSSDYKSNDEKGVHFTMKGSKKLEKCLLFALRDASLSSVEPKTPVPGSKRKARGASSGETPPSVKQNAKQTRVI